MICVQIDEKKRLVKLLAGFSSQEEIHLKIQQLQESIKVCVRNNDFSDTGMTEIQFSAHHLLFAIIVQNSQC